MKSIWPLSMCETLKLIVCALILSLAAAFVIALAVIVVVIYPRGFIEFFSYIKDNNIIGYLIAGATTVFAGSFVIFSAYATIIEQRGIAEQDRIQKLKAVRSILPSVYFELSKLCKSLTLLTAGINKNLQIYYYNELSYSSLAAIRLAIEYLKGSECEELFKVLIYYQIVMSKIDGLFSKRERKHSSGELKPEDLDPDEKKLIVDLVSLQSIAEVYAHFAIQGSDEFCMEMCKRQFRHNMQRYNKVSGETSDPIESIEKIFRLQLRENIEFDGYIGFLSEDYFNRYR